MEQRSIDKPKKFMILTNLTNRIRKLESCNISINKLHIYIPISIIKDYNDDNIIIE